MSPYLDDTRWLEIHFFYSIPRFATLETSMMMPIPPISDCEVRDPRIRRTRQLLQGALRSLLQTKSFDEISVQDIAEAATVNRATFYDHYADKYALLDALVAGGFHLLLHERNVQFDANCPTAGSAVIRAACDYVTLMRQGHSECSGQSAFEPLIDAAITTAIRRVLTRNSVSDSLLSPMAATAASWAINGAVKQWFNSPNRVSVEQAVQQILALVLPMLQTTSAQPARILEESAYTTP
jgi:AcrR family transcriptional regulator